MPASEQGVSQERYMLVPRTLVFLTRRDRVLLIKGATDKRLWPGLYNGIGGHIEQGEDVLSAARREVYEETGLMPSNLWLCGTVTVDTQTNPGVGIFVFKGEVKDKGLSQTSEGTLEWVNSQEIVQLPLVSDLRILLPIILPMKFGDAPFSAYSYYGGDGQIVTKIR